MFTDKKLKYYLSVCLFSGLGLLPEVSSCRQISTESAPALAVSGLTRYPLAFERATMGFFSVVLNELKYLSGAKRF